MRKLLYILSITCGFAVFLSAATLWQTTRQLDTLGRELRQVANTKPASAVAAAPRFIELEPVGAAALGSISAPVTMVYYTDYRCPFCRTFATQTLPELKRRFIDSGKLRLVVRDLAFHAGSVEEASAARCAGEFGKYWAFHDSLFHAKDSTVTPRMLRRIAARVGVPRDAFARCVNAKRYEAAVRADIAGAATLKIDGTPAFVIGKGAGKSMRGELVLGAQPVTVFDSLLSQLTR